CGPHADEVEEPGIDADAFQSFRVAGPGQVRRPIDERRQAVEDGILVTVVGEVERRKWRTVALGPRIPHPDKPLGFAHRQRAHDPGLQEGIPCGRGADAKGDGDDDRRRKMETTPPINQGVHGRILTALYLLRQQSTRMSDSSTTTDWLLLLYFLRTSQAHARV